MALTIGTDTYIDLEDADVYLNSYHLSTDADMVLWAALSDEHSEILLRKAARILDRQPLIGIKAVTTQTMEFPRAIYTDTTGYSNNIYGDWYVQSAVPDAVMYAQCEIALSLTSGESERQKMQREGVRSFTIGHLSESLIGLSGEVLPIEAKSLLAPYLATGGVPIV